MEMTLKQIADLIGATLVDAPDPEAAIKEIKPIEDAGPDSVTFLSSPKYRPLLETSAARAIICRPELAKRPHLGALLTCPQPYVAFAKLMQHWHSSEPEWTGVSAKAHIGEKCEIDPEVIIEPFVSIGEGCRIGARVHIRAGAVVGDEVAIGDDTVIHSNVNIYHGTRIGARCIVHAGATLGSDGFGFATDLTCGVHVKIPQVGIVVLEDDVEVGANSAIDRAVLGETRIGRGSKLDNLVQLAHNVKMGQGCFIVSQVGVAGSTELGNYVVLAGQVGVAGHLSIGDGAQVGAQSGVGRDVKAGEKLWGSPAQDAYHMKRCLSVLNKLPAMRKELRSLEKRCADEA